MPGRYDHRPTCLELRPIGGKQQSLWPFPIFRGQPRTNVSLVTDSNEYMSTGGWGFVQIQRRKTADVAVSRPVLPATCP